MLNVYTSRWGYLFRIKLRNSTEILVFLIKVNTKHTQHQVNRSQWLISAEFSSLMNFLIKLYNVEECWKKILT